MSTRGAEVEIAGTVALVTGGASGIGRRTAAALGRAGARVVVADVDERRGAEAAEDVGGRFARLDVGSSADWDAIADGIGAEEGRLDIAFLNAGVGTGEANPVALTDEQYRRAVSVNLDGVVFGIRAVLPLLQQRGEGAIVATASLGGLVPMDVDPVYSATKHAVVAYVRSVARQLREQPVTINAICPGFADTPLVGELERELIAALGVPLLDPEVVADTVLRVIREGRSGEAWFIQPGREPAPYEFRGVPGPRVAS